MEKVGITAERPALEGVLGPLSDSRDAAIRTALVTSGAALAAAAESMGFKVEGRYGALELAWYPSGQMSINGSISGCDALGNLVTFGVELRPAWFYGKKSDVLAWEIDTTVEVDCRHTEDHGGMDAVATETTTADSPEGAVEALLKSVNLVIRRVGEGPLEQWTKLGAD